jgi:putative membrane protein
MSKEERKALRSEQRARSNEAWQKGQAAMRSGDERHMPPAHAGPVRRFGRDMIDSRFSLASLFMPLALVLFVAMLLQSRFPALALAILLGTYVLFVIMVIDTGLAVHRTRILAQHKFGEDRVPRGFSTQLFSRSFYIRPWRMPRAQVRLGETPSGGTREDYRQARAARAGRGKG